jgi:hypothetical protein
LHAYKRAAVIDFIDRSFRDVADNDYAAARATYRLRLSQQFLWSALQALGKRHTEHLRDA